MSTDPNAEILTATEITARAVSKELGITLDYSLDSLGDLETLIQHVKSNFLNSKNQGQPTEHTVQRACVSMGGYLGEVIRRTYGGTWIAINPVMKTLLINGQEFSPILYIYQRLIQGADYSLEDYLSDVEDTLRPRENVKAEPAVPEVQGKRASGPGRNRKLIAAALTGLAVLAIIGTVTTTTHPNVTLISPTITFPPAATTIPATSALPAITEGPSTPAPIDFSSNLPDGFEIDPSVEQQDTVLEDGSRLFSIGYINRQALNPGDITSIAYFINFYPGDATAIVEYRKYLNDLETRGEGVLDRQMRFVGTDTTAMYISQQDQNRVAGQYTSRVRNVMVTTVGLTAYDPQTVSEVFLKSFMAKLAGFHILGLFKTH